MRVRNLVATLDLGQNVAVCVAELGNTAPFQVLRLECYPWVPPVNYKALGKHEKLAAWTAAAAEHLATNIGWVADLPDLARVVFERRWIHPTGQGKRYDPRTTEGIQEQADWLMQTFGERAHKVDPLVVTRETGIAKTSERYALTARLARPVGSPPLPSRVIDARTGWHQVLLPFDEMKGGSVTEHVLSAMKLAFWYCRAEAWRRKLEAAGHVV